MSYTNREKRLILVRDFGVTWEGNIPPLQWFFDNFEIKCVGVPELYVECGKRILRTRDCQFDAFDGDWMKDNDQDKHTIDEGRVQCLACAHYKTRVRDHGGAKKFRRINGLNKKRSYNWPSRKLPSRPMKGRSRWPKNTKPP